MAVKISENLTFATTLTFFFKNAYQRQLVQMIWFIFVYILPRNPDKHIQRANFSSLL